MIVVLAILGGVILAIGIVLWATTPGKTGGPRGYRGSHRR